MKGEKALTYARILKGPLVDFIPHLREFPNFKHFMAQPHEYHLLVTSTTLKFGKMMIYPITNPRILQISIKISPREQEGSGTRPIKIMELIEGLSVIHTTGVTNTPQGIRLETFNYRDELSPPVSKKFEDFRQSGEGVISIRDVQQI